MNKAMFLKVGSFVLSTIIQAIVPSGKIYTTINPKYFMPLIFTSVFITFGILFLRIHNLPTPIKNNVTTKNRFSKIAKF
jgi:hypothetical protein